MRLVLLTNVFPSPLAPTKGTFNFEMAKALAIDHELTVVCPISWTDELQAWRRHGIRIPAGREFRKDNIRTLYPRFWYPPRIARHRYDRFLYWSISKTLDRVAGEVAPEAVLGYWAHPDGAVAVRWANKLGVPGWIMVGGSDVLLLTRDKRRRYAIEDAFRGASGVITVSHNIAQKLQGIAVADEKIHVVYRGIDRKRFFPGDKVAARRATGLPAALKTFLWVGRMVEVKGLNVLLEAAAQVRAKGVNFLICLIGDGPLRPALERQVQLSGLSENVRFIGSRPHEELATWYRAADWTVLCSRSEGVPNTLLESHACGTPFVATAVGGIPEIAVKGMDRLVPVDDPEALAFALVAAAADSGREENPQCLDILKNAVTSLESAANLVTDLLRTPISSRQASFG